LQRADLWLRVQTPRGDAEARQLLEPTLAELPKSAHGHAALAEACLRLDDAECARDAIQKAIQVRPRRAKYRALEAKISDTFAATGR
jgi:cytochrome c-type biogenesis protein CcmH/NrfG